MAKKKLREEFVQDDLNLLPIMNLICLLIPFLLMAAQFIKIGVIMVETPRLSRVKSSEEKKKKEALNLSLVMTDKGFYIKSRHGSECPEGVSADAKLCFPKKEGKYTDKVLKELQHHMWYLYASKYKDPSSYAVPDEKHSLTLIPEPTIKYDDIVRTLDAIREIPRDARNPPVKHSIPGGGCAMKYDRKSGGWGFLDKGGVSIKESACMYYRVTLALGSS
ncbi:MAG: biopolymer transporter ExbD [bacterium]